MRRPLAWPDHDRFARRPDSENPSAAGEFGLMQSMGQVLDPGMQRIDLVLQLQDALDAGKADAFLLRKALDLAQPGDVPRRIAPAAALRA